MKINTLYVLKRTDGNALLQVNDAGKEADMTFRAAVVNALLGTYPNEQISGTQKLDRYRLAMRVQGEDDVELSAEDAALIKNLVGIAYPPLVVGQVFPLLDGE